MKRRKFLTAVVGAIGAGIAAVLVWPLSRARRAIDSRPPETIDPPAGSREHIQKVLAEIHSRHGFEFRENGDKFTVINPKGQA